jgi:hypothetical protein
MTRMICLANSIRDGGRCVAGIDLKSGGWIRPVPPGGGGIPTRHVTFSGRLLKPLDIVELALKEPQPATRFQRENRVVRGYGWRRVGVARLEEVLRYCDRAVPVLHSASDRVDPAVLGHLPPALWQSLQLIRANPVTFGRDRWDARRWRARFRDRLGNHYALKVTDPCACDRLERGERLNRDCLLTISLVKPWTYNPEDKPATCYKLVAAVIELNHCGVPSKRPPMTRRYGIYARRSGGVSSAHPINSGHARATRRRTVGPVGS